MMVAQADLPERLRKLPGTANSEVKTVAYEAAYEIDRLRMGFKNMLELQKNSAEEIERLRNDFEILQNENDRLHAERETMNGSPK